MRVLIVDDSRFIRQHLRQLLQGMGMNCEEAEDGREAIDLLRGAAAFDFMLVDVNMPVMNGLECVKQLRQAGLHPRMKVCLLYTSRCV